MVPFVRNHPALRYAVLVTGALTLAGGLAGCARPQPETTGSIDSDGFRTRHPIVVEEGMETLDIPAGIHSDRLTAQLANTVEGFAREARRKGARGVVVMVPSGSANEVGAKRLSDDILRALTRGGVPAHLVERRPYPAEGPEDVAPIRVAYPRIVARVPHECGEWPAQATSDYGNGDYWNFGCATQANMAAMVDNPADFVAPAQIGAPDATRRAGVLQSYRKGEKTKSQFDLPSPSVGQVSGGSGG